MSSSGYYRHPTIHQQRVVFVCEDDLWSVDRSGGPSHRLTTSLGAASYPALSPDGRWLAFTGRDEGSSEVYVMPSEGGEVRRLTYLGARSCVVGWTPRGEVVFTSDAAQPFTKPQHLFAVASEGGQVRKLPTGPAQFISFSESGRCVIGRNATDPALWKRYRGGTAGDLWIDRHGDGDFRRLLTLDGNVSRPLWLGGRIYFVSDHEGVGNLYSCTPSGRGLKRHTHHHDFYVRHPMSDGQRIVYHAGADLFVFDVEQERSDAIPVEYRGPRAQRQRRFVDAEDYLHDVEIHPKGHLLALSARGKCFTMGNWEGPAAQLAPGREGRRRLVQWLNDGERVVLVSDESGEERLEVMHASAAGQRQSFEHLDIGRVLELVVCPKANRVAISNHRNELLLLDVDSQKLRRLDKNEWAHITGLAWSPDGRYVAYSYALSQHTAAIRVCDMSAAKPRTITRPVLQDSAPSFDPEGKYLYFLSSRQLDPVYDTLHFDLGFPRGIKPYLIVLQADQRSPFFVEPKPADEDTDEDAEISRKKKKPRSKKPARVRIDFDGIETRVVAFPVGDGVYGRVEGIVGKALFTSLPIEGALSSADAMDDDDSARASLHCYDFETRRGETLVSGISDFSLSRDGRTMLLRSADRLRVLEAGMKPDEANEDDEPGRRSGWIDLERIRLEVRPAQEWRQMYGETWRLQRDHFWTEDMSKVDWQGVFERYAPLVERVSSRGELSDLLWEMQGELGTSHAYELGGDHRQPPNYAVGKLGADVQLDQRTGLWKIVHICQGDSWNPTQSSPLLEPGIQAKVGDTLLAINGRRLTSDTSPDELLVHLAGVEVRVTLGNARGKQPRNVTLKTLPSETALRYREWVEGNRRWVHDHSEGRIGYVHVPDMSAHGYAEFHRYFLSEIDRHGLIVDVRFNGGGHVSELILEKLARRRIGYDHARWFRPTPYPRDSVAGPIVALTNEYAGSDGDIFCHGFKLLKLGPLIGKRTWGGVIGMWARHHLVDGSITTQPEFSFWFEDVGWSIENYGTQPDIEVEMRPQDFAEGRDPQLERALKEAQRLLRHKPGTLPQPGPRPDLSVPPLPTPS